VNWFTVARLLMEALGCIRAGSALSCVNAIGAAFEIAQQLQAANVPSNIPADATLAQIEAEEEKYFWEEAQCALADCHCHTHSRVS